MTAFLAHLLGDQSISIDFIQGVVGLIVGAVGAGVGTFGLMGKRKDELVELYKGLYDAKSKDLEDAEARHHATVTGLEARLRMVEGQVAVLQSDFTKQLAAGITEAIIRKVDEQMGRKP